jgi:hypothetical protein
MDQTEYLKAKRRLSRRSSARIEQSSPVKRGLAWAAPFPLTLGGGFLVVIAVDGNSSHLGSWLVGTLAATVLFWFLMSWTMVDACRSDQARVGRLRESVEAYEASESRRVTKENVRDIDSMDKSKRQLQHEWYGPGNSDLNWRDREMGEALGIPNGDIYKSNWE